MAEKKMQLEDWLDDLCVRFIINLPQEDLSTVARICFHVEEAQWFYEDFIRPLDPTLPSMSLRSFCLRIFQHCPLLSSFSVENHMRAFEEFLQYKTRVPVRGAILLNHDMDSTVLVKGWKKGANWSFPRGKINKDEDDLDCAVREVYEETGFDIKAAGLVPKDDEVKYIQISMREQQIRLYVFKDIPMDTAFQPMTRKEISKIQWYKLSELPAFRKKGNNAHDGAAAAASNANKFYMVAPFLVPLKKWVVQQQKRDAHLANNSLRSHLLPEEPVTEDDIGTHTEPIPDPMPGPAIETLEGATRELQRLLNIQPQAHLPLDGAGQDKGASLMAILQRKEQDARHQHQHQDHKQQPLQHHQQQPPQQPYQQPAPGPHQLPHTPMDLLYSNAPQPHTPHHHHPTQRLPANYSQPPPNFPIPSHFNPQVNPAHRIVPQFHQDIPVGLYNQQRVQQHMTAQNAAYLGFHPSTRLFPGNQQTSQPVLVHPQPLPPQVQQSLLVRGILPTPNLEAMANRIGYSQNLVGDPAANQQGPVGPRQQIGPKIPQPQLSDHKRSLLNAFKTDAPSSAGPETQGANLPGVAFQGPLPGPVAQDSPANLAQPLVAWASHPGAPAFAPASQALPAALVPSSHPASSAGAQSGVALLAKPAQHTEKHRSALLDIFKGQGPLSPTSSEATVRQPGQAQNSGATSIAGPTQPKPLSSADAIRAAAQANGGPVVMKPEANLPFRALEILSRPKHSEGNLARDAHVSQQHGTPSFASSAHQDPGQRYPMEYQGKPSPQTQSVAMRDENEAKTSPRLPHHHQSTGLPYGMQAQQPVQSPLAKHSFSGVPVPAPRQDANPEQKQKLLSLFGRPQDSPTRSTPEAKGKGKEPVMYDQSQGAAARSRVTSIAGSVDVGGTSMSRQNSQTPISPADRSFLLDYLQQVSKSNP